MQPQIQVKRHGPSGTIVLNRPEKRNALSRALIADLQQAFEDFHLERSVRAVILTGAGSAFSAGIDLDELYETSRQENPHPQWYEDAVQLRDLIRCLLEFPKPIIAAVNGPAVAAGAGLVLASDVVIAGKEAGFGFPEPRRGIVSGLAAPLLHFRVGGSTAARLLLTASAVDAVEAQRLGVFHEVVATDLVWARAQEVAVGIARCAPQALRLTKQLINQTIGEQLETLMTAGAATSATARTTDDAREGLAAFREKREPRWT